MNNIQNTQSSVLELAQYKIDGGQVLKADKVEKVQTKLDM